MLYIVTVCLLLCAVASAQVISLGKCASDIKTQDKFDLDEYLGDWYELYRYPAAFENDAKCNKATYTREPDNHIKIFNTGVSPDGAITNATGDGVQPDPENDPAKLSIKFAPGAPYGKYWVLTTDYKVALVYSCTDIAGISHVEFAWILGRERTLEESKVEELMAILKNYGSNTSKFVKTDQDGCNN